MSSKRKNKSKEKIPIKKIKLIEDQKKPSTSGLSNEKENNFIINNDLDEKSNAVLENQQKIVPISTLNPFQSIWTIKAKVTSKRPIHNWKNAKNSGKLFNMNLYDESAQIRVTVFNDLVDKFYNKIECEKVYYIRRRFEKCKSAIFSSKE